MNLAGRLFLSAFLLCALIVVLGIFFPLKQLAPLYLTSFGLFLILAIASMATAGTDVWQKPENDLAG